MIGFRVDANEKIATGHLMRCMAIAEMCREKGEDVLFFLAEEKETERLQKQNFPYHILQTDWQDMESEIPVMKELLSRKKVSALVVDSYQATVRYLKELNTCIPVLYMDDMAKEYYPVSAVVHYGLGTENKEYLSLYWEQGVHVMAGTKYVPLREEFRNFDKRKVKACSGQSVDEMNQFLLEENKKRKNRILVTTGGTDPFQITKKFLDACFSYGKKEGKFLREYEYDVILGALNSQREELENIAKKNERIHLHYNVSNMSDYMKRCKMAVSAGGTTLYELCACGIPTACFSFADNQETGTVCFGEAGLMEYAGDARRTDVALKLVEALIDLEKNPPRYLERQRNMIRTVDGKGAIRIAEELLRLKDVRS